MKIVTVHGFNVRDGGARTVDKLAPFIEKLGWIADIDDADYGYVDLLSVRLFKRKKHHQTILKLAQAFTDCDVIITHSNGAYYTTQALHLIKTQKTVIHISPALNSKTPPPKAVLRQLVLFTPHDGWVKLASYLPAHPWGRMGARGYQGDSEKVMSIMDANVHGHSDWFSDTHISSTWQYCHNFIKEKAS